MVRGGGISNAQGGSSGGYSEMVVGGRSGESFVSRRAGTSGPRVTCPSDKEEGSVSILIRDKIPIMEWGEGSDGGVGVVTFFPVLYRGQYLVFVIP